MYLKCIYNFRLFSEYIMDGVTKEENEIYLQLQPELLVSILLL